MKNRIVLLAALASMLALAACGQKNDTAPVSTDAQMSMRVEPEPLAVGETTLIVTLTDSSGSPLDGATLNVHGNMDHAGMQPVDREINQSINGEYRIPFEWTMGGGWIVTVTAHLPNNGGQLTQTFEYFVEAVSSESIVNQHTRINQNPDSASVRIVYEPDRNPALGGDATVTIRLVDAQDRPITGAAVSLVANMSHHGMLPVSGEGAPAGNGEYSVPLRWTMAGDWQVTVTVTLADGTIVEETFDQQVVMP